jgi:pimeloyl-ACP methyl ester carboxylesterase
VKRFAAVAAILAVVGCSSDSGDEGSAARARFERGPCPQTPEPIPGLENARCGVLIVPEDRSDEGGRTIRLAVVRIPALSPTPAPDPILFVTGGPGNSAILDARVITEPELNRDRDVILMSARGTWGATPNLNCPEVEDFEEQMASLAYDARSTGDGQVDAVRRCRERIVAREDGIDLSAYNTTEAVADYADLRIALGIEEWNVLGHSYGSYLVQVMMRERPEGIRSVLLEGIVPPAKVNVESWPWESMEEALDNILRACAAQAACAARYPEVRETFVEQVNRLEVDPIRTTVQPPEGPPVDVVLDGGALVNVMARFVHSPADIPLALDELAAGNPQPIAEIWAAKWAPLPPTGRAAFAEGFHYSGICTEWIPHTTADRELASARQEWPELPDSVLAQGPQFPFMREKCDVWDVRAAPASILEPTHSDIPTLVMVGTFDAATGPGNGDTIARGLTNSTVVQLDGVAHGAFAHPAGLPCGPEIVRSFFNAPDAPDTSCAASVRPEPFTIG